MYNIVSYLKSCGHKEIGYISSGWEFGWQKDRRQCFRCSLAELDLEEHREFFFRAGVDDDLYDHQKLVQAFSQAEHLPTALVCENDRQAMRTVNALRQLGYRVPEDISVTGFDNNPISKMVSPRLTTVKNSSQLMGRTCILLLQDLRKLRRSGFSSTLLKYELPAELVIRDSVKDLNAE